MNELAKTREPRRWLRFRLRTMFVLVTLVAVSLGWTTYRLRKKQKLIASIQETGSVVYFDYERTAGGKWISDPKPPGPQWMRKFLGPHWNTSVTGVILCRNGRREPTDKDVEALRSFRHLTFLAFYHCYEVTDNGLKHVGECRELKSLAIDGGPNLTDEGFAHLRTLSKLTSLTIERADISDRGLEQLSGLTSLKNVQLSGTEVTEDGVARLKQALPNLKVNFSPKPPH